MRYRMYVDESGDHVNKCVEKLREIPHRFLCLCGVVLEYGEIYNVFAEELERIKRKHLKYHADEPIILHREDIIHKRGAFHLLQNAIVHKEFDTDLLLLLEETDYTIISVVIDKYQQIKQYPNPWHPYHTALTYLMQRYCFFLSNNNSQGDILAESRGKREDNLLKNAYTHIYTHGDIHNTSQFYKTCLTTKQIKLKPKNKNIAGLQLADLLATNVKKYILDKHHIQSLSSTPFINRLTKIICLKLRKKPNGTIMEGYGYILWPK